MLTAALNRQHFVNVFGLIGTASSIKMAAILKLQTLKSRMCGGRERFLIDRWGKRH